MPIKEDFLSFFNVENMDDTFDIKVERQTVMEWMNEQINFLSNERDILMKLNREAHRSKPNVYYKVDKPYEKGHLRLIDYNEKAQLFPFECDSKSHKDIQKNTKNFLSKMHKILITPMVSRPWRHTMEELQKNFNKHKFLKNFKRMVGFFLI